MHESRLLPLQPMTMRDFQPHFPLNVVISFQKKGALLSWRYVDALRW
jgi:hypothetical protein